VAFRTAPEWEPLNAPSFPTEDSLLVESVETDAQERLETIQSQLGTGRASPFLTAFERACIFHAQGNLFLRDREIEQAIDHMSAGYPRAIVALYGWLQRENPDLARKLRVRMYRPEALERLFNAGRPQAVLDAYLAGFSDTRLIKLESARLVLDHTRNPEWRAHATSVLIKFMDDIPAVVDMVKEGVFSEEIGLDLLAENCDRALTMLHDMPVDPVRDKLLFRLAIQTRSGRVIRPGIWVRSGAGWGQLAAIHVGDKARPYLFLDETGCPEEDSLLTVKLHRNDRIWQLEIDTAKKELRLLGATQVYRCTRDDCTGFASVDRDEVIRIHCTTAHLGIGPAYKKSTPKWRYHRPIAFSWHVQHPYA